MRIILLRCITPIYSSVSRAFSRLYATQTISRLLHKHRVISALTRRKFVGLDNLDEKLASIIFSRKGYFVELGANDGIAYSNTLYFELFRKWKGILIEPSPVEFKELQKNRSRRSVFINAACVDFDYKAEEIELIYSGLMTIDVGPKTGITDTKRHAEIGLEFIDGNNYRFTARAKTLTSILEEAGAPIVMDLLSLDVEGSELNVLNGFDFTKYKFRYLLIETRDLDVVKKYLELRAYKLKYQLSTHDYLFTHQIT